MSDAFEATRDGFLDAAVEAVENKEASFCPAQRQRNSSICLLKPIM